MFFLIILMSLFNVFFKFNFFVLLTLKIKIYPLMHASGSKTFMLIKKKKRKKGDLVPSQISYKKRA